MQPDKLFAILAEPTEFAELLCILRSITTNIHKRMSRVRKSSIMPKLVRLISNVCARSRKLSLKTQLNIEVLEDSTSVLAMVLTPPSSVKVMTVNLADIPGAIV